MGDDDDWQKLSIEDKVSHKLWKARLAGYEEAAKKFRLIDSDKSPEYLNFLGSIKNFVTDSNAAAQEKGLEAALSFVENAACASKCCSDVVTGIISKVLTARPKSKQLGVDILLMFIEIEKQDVVMEELVNGFSQKNPKVIAACISTSCQALREFGGKVIMMKGLVKLIPTLLSHSDQGVRAETKELAIEIFKWIRDAIKPQLLNIKPVQLKELEDEWQKLEAVPPVPTRFTRSEQAKRAAAPPPTIAAGGKVDENGGAPQAAAAVFIDPWEMFDPVDILSQMPKDFYELVESKKWQERKETLEALEKLTSNPKLEAGQYGEVCAVLKKVITKDSNVVVVAIAANCVTGLAKGLRKKFQTYSGLLIPAILGKFKEKKLNVVIALRDALDAVFATTNFTNIMEDLLASLDNKNPQIKEETCRFITRTCSTSTVAAFPKSVLKLVAPALVLRLDDTVGSVRDTAAESLGTVMKLVGERAMAAYLDSIDKLKQEKVKEYFEKAVLTPSAGGGASGNAGGENTTTTAAAAPAASASSKAGPSKPVPKSVQPKEEEKKPVSNAPPNKVVKPKSGGAATKPGGKKVVDQKKKKKKVNDFEEDLKELTEPELPEGVVESQAEGLFGEECIKQMASNNWKERLAAVEEMTKKIEGMDDKSFPSQVVVRTLAKNPGWKDSNFQVMNVKFKLLAIVAKKSDFTRRSAWYAVAGLISKIGDAKLKTQVSETLKIFSENISLNYISLKIAAAAEEAKNPKLQSEALVWMSEAVREFGFRIDLKPHIAFIKTSLANTNPAVRKAAIEFLATLHLYVGANIRVFFEDEKAALLQQIDEEFSKNKDLKPPIPIRKFIDDEEEDKEVGEDNQQENEEPGAVVVNLEDMVERVNISGKITDEVLAKISDKNWKIRKEGLEEVQGFINEAKFITPDINELPTSIKARLADNNKVLVQLTISICKQLAESGGSGMIRHKAIILPALIGTFTDAKPALRNLAEEALDAWHSKIGFLPFLDGEILSTALQVQNPNLRATLLSWLEKKLPNEKKLPAEFKDSIFPLYVCLEDRNPDVRKAAQAVVPLFMAHVGFDAMCKATAKLDAASKTVVQAIIDKARETCVPIAAPGKKVLDSGNKQTASAPQPIKSSAAPSKVSSDKSDLDLASVKSSKEVPKKTKEEKPVKADPKKSAPPKASGGVSGRKKDFVEDDGPPIILKVGKAQRIKDEKALKVLKWNFTVPRDEFLDQLKEQMLPCFSASMHAKLFHKDFKFHLEALSILTSCVTEYSEAMVESLDLILKWVSLRFFDTNTSVLLKALEFLTVLFNFLDSNKQKLNNFEASAFIPYLVGKIGDPKDNVRKSVHDLCRLVTNIYPASQMFVYLMQGLESKNSKSRMECCEELGFLISKFGIDVCQPNPKVLKDIAVQIADRDNGVRSAALNCIVEAYNIVGDQVYKLIGKLADKEMGYLEERIKRTGNKKEQPPKQLANVKPRQPSKSTEDTIDSNEAGVQVKQDLELNKPTIKTNVPPPLQIKREFELDLRSIEGDEGIITANIPQLKKVNLDDITQAANIPDNLLKAYSSSSKISSTNASTTKDVGELLDLTIAKISSSDTQAAMESLVQLEDVFRKKKTDNEIVKRVDQYLVTSLVQMKMLFSRHMQSTKENSEEHERLLKLLLSGMLSLFDAQCYAGVVSYNVLKDVILYFISVLNDKLLMNFQEPDLSIQCVNRLLLRVITNSNKTSCLCSCIKLLQDMSENENTSTSLIKLVMKCIWKLTHLLPDFINEVRLPAVLLSIHTFYSVLPPSLWRIRTDRVPQQTVKALLQTLCKLRGPELYDSINTLDNKNASEVPLYIMKHCSKGTLDSTDSNGPPPIRFTQPSNEVLVEIFKKIGSKENSRAGILELHYFKQQYPDYDVNPYIKNTSPFFQNFIDRSLKTIATEEKLKLINNRENSSQSAFSSSHTISGSESEKYMDRLRILKEKFQKSSQSQPSTSSISDEILNEPQVEVNKPEKEDQIKVDVKVEEKKSFDLDDIKKRLALIKGSNR
ncbi:cytoskeleton-associated protein 5 isoform X1 [Hydra vulgaris]|uniref:cytoskeleton-associated protein 5 isoform X1 n=1 Tax=Hydra vulgaris TaxID=6087 RepID=UPI0006414C80|nr:cytoskeleton-associated protein 5 [Hydra vulgaris]